MKRSVSQFLDDIAEQDKFRPGFGGPGSAQSANGRHGGRLSSCRHGVGYVRLCLLLATFAVTAFAQPSPRERISLNAGWRFAKNDPAGTGDLLSYPKIKAWLLPSGNDFASAAAPRAARPEGNLGGDVAYTQPGFDDQGWRRLDLPHDWGIEGPFKQEYPGESGKLPWWGVAWYRKHFEVSREDACKRFYVSVDGAMAYAAVWLNGQFVGGWPYGYASWQLDLTPYLKPGAENIIAIRLDNPPDSSRWYPGGGIYRNVWLEKTAPIHVAHWGTFVTTPRVSAAEAVVRVEAVLDNDTADSPDVQVETRLYELDAAGRPTGEAVATGAAMNVRLNTNHQTFAAQSLTVAHPKLWSVHAPQRYVAVTTVEQGGRVLDRSETPFGIRTIAFTADHGFLLNGDRVQINGVCGHHDELGALGTALNVRALERKLQLLKEMGCNAIRTSHNPPPPELLDLTDRLGFIVMDEAFDCWRTGKRPNDYNLLFPDWHEKDLRALIRRDRNHPSVVLWSIGNEIREQEEPEGWKLAAQLAAIVRGEDRTRYVTAGCQRTVAGYNGFQTALDVMGSNYQQIAYDAFREYSPTIPIVGSETVACISSRGEYFFPFSDDKGLADFQVSSYDLYAPSFAMPLDVKLRAQEQSGLARYSLAGWMPPDAEFRAQEQNPFVAGEFVWIGFDHLGEPLPYKQDATKLLNYSDPAEKARAEKELQALGKILVPSRNTYFGIFDLAGFPKDRFYLYQVHWRPDLPMAHILPHWNWPERVGQVTPVHVYTSGDEAELFLNGRSLGRKKKGPYEYRLRWEDVVYEPGELKVVAYKRGAKWAGDVVRTTGPAAQLTLKADRATIRPDGQDLSFVTVTVANRGGLLVPRSKNHVKFSISGPGEIVATDNGDPTSFESFQAPERKAFNGLALVIVRARAGEPGPITLRAESDGLAGAEISLTTN